MEGFCRYTTGQLQAPTSKVLAVGRSSWPNEDGIIVCAIGDNWFYFEKERVEYFESVKEYKESIPKEDIIKSIFETLDNFQTCGFVEFQDEVEYYESLLNEHGIGLDEGCMEY